MNVWQHEIKHVNKTNTFKHITEHLNNNKYLKNQLYIYLLVVTCTQYTYVKYIQL